MLLRSFDAFSHKALYGHPRRKSISKPGSFVFK
jgi:hypothetical protein